MRKETPEIERENESKRSRDVGKSMQRSGRRTKIATGRNMGVDRKKPGVWGNSEQAAKEKGQKSTEHERGQLNNHWTGDNWNHWRF